MAVCLLRVEDTTLQADIEAARIAGYLDRAHDQRTQDRQTRLEAAVLAATATTRARSPR